MTSLTEASTRQAHEAMANTAPTGVPCPAVGLTVDEPGSSTWPATCPRCRRYLNVEAGDIDQISGRWVIQEHESFRPIDILTHRLATTLRRMLHPGVLSDAVDEVDLAQADHLIRGAGLDQLVGTGALPRRHQAGAA